jgi:uncharacterized protein with NAD-binding domain and iron-sulfur cluster
MKLGDPALDDINFGDWLRQHGQSDRAIARLWNLIVQPTLNVSVDHASLALAAQVFQVGFLRDADGADMGWSTIPLARLHGEYGARALDAAGVVTRLNTAVHSITRTDEGAFVVDIDGESLKADSVIVATSPRVAATLGVIGSDVATELGTSPIVNIQFVFDRKVTDLVMAACVDSPIEFVFDRSDAAGAHDGQCLVISLSAADTYLTTGSSELVPFFLSALGDIFPLAHDAQVLSAVVTREAAATFRAGPGVETLRASIATQETGLFTAGAWCDTGWPATMEGAVRSGSEAASEVLSLFSESSSAAPFNRESVTS